MSIEIKFTDEEANSEALVIEAMPSGEEICAFTDVQQAEVKKEGKNKGKPFYKVELTVQQGKYEKRKLWSTVMLFEGAAYDIAQIMKAMGLVPGKDPIPSASDLEGTKVVAVWRKVKDEYKMEKEGSKEIIYKNEVTGYKPISGSISSSNNSAVSSISNSGSGNSILP